VRRRRPSRRSREQALALRPLAGELARPPDGLTLLARLPHRRLLKELLAPELAKDAFALQLSLEHLESLVDVVVANNDLHALHSSIYQPSIGDLASAFADGGDCLVQRRPTKTV
jgi:hypothetical protein